MTPASTRIYRVHGLRLQTEFAMREIAGCEEPLDAAAADARAAPDLWLRRASRRALPEPRSRDWSVRSASRLSVAHGAWGSLFQAYCGSRAWLPEALPGRPMVLHIARAPGLATDAFHHTVLHTFVPLALALQGHTLMHAACVVCEGQAFLYAGASGMGKSTLAAGFAARGLPVYADDVVRVDVGDASTFGMAKARTWPGYPGSRLRSSSFLLPAQQRNQPAGRYGLPRFRVYTERIAQAPPEGVPVGGIFFLARSPRCGPEFTPLSAVQALRPWVESSFLLSLPRATRSREAFARATRFVSMVSAWHLAYRRSPAHFETLLDALIERMASPGGTP